MNWIKRKLGIMALQWTVGSQDTRIKRLEELVEVGIDVHMKSESWAVVCIAGKGEFAKFYKLPSNELIYIRDLLQRLEKEYHTRAIVDAPLGVSKYWKW